MWSSDSNPYSLSEPHLRTLGFEHRFAKANTLAEPIEWLTDNGSCYTAQDTRRFARDTGLVPSTTPVESPQSNGRAEAFVRTVKRGSARVASKPDARTVIEQLPGWFAHNNAYSDEAGHLFRHEAGHHSGAKPAI